VKLADGEAGKTELLLQQLPGRLDDQADPTVGDSEEIKRLCCLPGVRG
jgi:hypothetical protein